MIQRAVRLCLIDGLVKVAPLQCNKDRFVAKIEGKIKKSVGRAAVRKPYLPPTLKEFGPVGALTQAGTGAKTEGGRWACTPMGQVSKMC